MSVTIHHGRLEDILPTIPANSIDSVVTDTPYHLTAGKSGGGFMGMKWDGGNVAFRVDTWQAVFRVLKPGAHLLAFGGTRTHHRLVCAIEDAGFEIRDEIDWVFGSGFPKSLNLDGEWDGWGTALKPAKEPICLARKPLIGTVEDNIAVFRTGAINIDGCRVESDGPRQATAGFRTVENGKGWGVGQGGDSYVKGTGATMTEVGRWPANLIHDGSEEVLAAFPTAPGQIADASMNDSPRNGQHIYGALRRGRAGEASANSENAGPVGFKMKPGERRLDAGSAARFFYCAKATKKDREDGCANLPARQQDDSRKEGNPGGDNPRNRGLEPRKNFHPTVKPTALMRYLCRIVTPPGGTVLDCFMGSGSTGRGAVLEGFGFVGIEMTEDYLPIARARIAASEIQPELNFA